jgi:hypothetical protein
MNKKQNPYFYLLIALFISFSCSNTAELDEGLVDNFDRQQILENVTDNIILPAFEDFTQKIVQLEESVTLFTNTKNLIDLEEVQVRWFEAYKIWQHIEMFNILKAEEVYFIQKMNTYPASVSKIENNISTGDYDLETNNNNWVAQGFPTLDYLLFGLKANNTSTLLFYQNIENIAYLNYLQAFVSQMVDITEIVSQDWIVSRDIFVSSSENSATSSLNMLTNDFIYYFEKGLRTNKFGIPAGVFSANNARVGNVEAYYNSTKSKELSLEALKAVRGFFKGETYNSAVTGASLKSYLDYMTESNILSSAIITKFDESEQLINNLDANFADQIVTNNSLMINVFNKLQEGVILLKTDLLSVLSISVDYIDADGD